MQVLEIRVLSKERSNICVDKTKTKTKTKICTSALAATNTWGQTGPTRTTVQTVVAMFVTKSGYMGVFN